MKSCCSALVLITLFAGAPGLLSASSAPLPERVELPVMRTSIYIGSVKLTTTAFLPSAEIYTATYEAKVTPWVWWNESGTISLTVTPDEYDRLLRGETIELKGEATNDQGKVRHVSVRAQPDDATRGRIKVRILAKGTTLIFNSSYLVTPSSASLASTGG